MPVLEQEDARQEYTKDRFLRLSREFHDKMTELVYLDGVNTWKYSEYRQAFYEAVKKEAKEVFQFLVFDVISTTHRIRSVSWYCGSAKGYGWY